MICFLETLPPVLPGTAELTPEREDRDEERVPVERLLEVAPRLGLVFLYDLVVICGVRLLGREEMLDREGEDTRGELVPALERLELLLDDEPEEDDFFRLSLACASGKAITAAPIIIRSVNV